MALRKALAISAGQLQQIQSADRILTGATYAAEVESLTNANAGSLVIGTPVYSSAAGSVNKAQANAAATSRVIGLVYDTTIATTVAGNIRTDGIMVATTTQWDAVTGGSGGLTAGSTYYLSAATAGMLTTTAPTTAGQYIVPVGVALSTTQLRVELNSSIFLSDATAKYRPLVAAASGQIEKASVGSLLEIGLVNTTQAANLTGSTIVKCRPVCFSSSLLALAKADDVATSEVIGIVYDTSILNAAVGLIAVDGLFEATTTQWDVVTGQSGGLTIGSRYYLSPFTAGALTTVKPTGTGNLIVPVGTALTTTVMRIDPLQKELNDVLTANETIYVDGVSGNDTTGTGAVGAPYATLARAASHYVLLIPSNFTITVHLEPGTITAAEAFSVAYPYGASLFFEGETETLAAPAVSGIDAAFSTDANYPELDYFDFDLDVTGTGAAAGHFVHITTATGGTRPELINGLHRIESVVSNTATCRVWADDGAAKLLPSGAITVSNVKLLKSVVQFTDDDHGISVNGLVSMGQWDNIVILGNQTAYTNNRAGIDIFGNASIRSVSGLYFHQWARGIQPIASLVYFQAGGISKCKALGINASVGSFVRFTSATINGCGSHAIQCSGLSQINAAACQVHSCGGAGILLDNSSRADVSSGNFAYPGNASQTGLFARDLSFMDAESATVTGYTTTQDPITPLGNDYSLILTNSEIGVQPAKIIYGYGSGTNYTLTNSSAEVDEGTDSAITVDQAGTYRVEGGVALFYNGATFAASQDITLKLRRTNNTAADVSNSAAVLGSFVLTTFTGYIQMQTQPATYTTTNLDDRLALFIDVAATPSVGSLEVSSSWIVAERIA